MKKFLLLALVLVGAFSLASAQYVHGWIKVGQVFTLNGAMTSNSTVPIPMPLGTNQPLMKGSVLLKLEDLNGGTADSIFKPVIGWRVADKAIPSGSFGDSLNRWFPLAGVDTTAAILASSFYWAVDYDFTGYNPSAGVHLWFQNLVARDSLRVTVVAVTY